MKLALLALVLAGLGSDHCNGASIYPVYEAADMVSDDRLLGTWWSGVNQGWIVAPGGGLTYDARAFEGADTTDYELVLVEVDDARLADLRPPSQGDRYELLRLHWYSRLHLTDGQLTYQALNDSWVETYVPAHPREIAYLVIDGAVIFTAKPREVQRFLRRHWNDAGAWAEAVTFGRTRPEE